MAERWTNKCSNARKITFPRRRLCWAFGRESKGLFIGNFFLLAAPSLGISTVNNWIGLHKNSRESRIECTSCVTTRDHMLQSRRDKNDWSSDGLPFHIHLILLTWLLQTTICFILFLIICARKNSTTRTISKWISWTSSTKSRKTFTKAGYFLYQRVGGKAYTVMEHALLKISCVLAVKKTQYFLANPIDRKWSYPSSNFIHTQATSKWHLSNCIPFLW